MAPDRDMSEQDALDAAELGRRRAGARRTALILAGIAVVIFVAFLVTGVTGRG